MIDSLMCIIDWWLDSWQLQAELTTVDHTAQGNKKKIFQPSGGLIEENQQRDLQYIL